MADCFALRPGSSDEPQIWRFLHVRYSSACDAGFKPLRFASLNGARKGSVQPNPLGFLLQSKLTATPFD